MRAYIDTNVIIDLLAKRAPYWRQTEKMFELIIDGKMIGYISSSSFTDIYYICKKTYHDEQMTRKKMIELLYFLEIMDTLSIDAKAAFDTALNDYEDGLIEEMAYNNKLDCIITRNKKDFKKSRTPVYTPSEFLSVLKIRNKKKNK